MLVSFMKGSCGQAYIGLSNFKSCFWTGVFYGSLIYCPLLLALALDGASVASTSAGLFLFWFVLTQKFFVVCCDYLLHIWRCSITNFYGVPIEYFEEGVGFWEAGIN